ncbi:hypothetical protein PIB30_065258 [Stylosanthes scabra]|uniref:Uncharacterized protein n=1 Tax=Stylosanthes scabra TaxID=79078 RepID=A0ABU6SM19_9FABA|nr:hypothetical protein [Stylosanthes scabra]
MAEVLCCLPYIATNEWQSRNFAVWSSSGQTFSEGVRFRTQNITYSINVCSCPSLIVLRNTQFTLYGRGQKSRGSHHAALAGSQSKKSIKGKLKQILHLLQEDEELLPNEESDQEDNPNEDDCFGVNLDDD